MEGVALRLWNVYGPGQALSNPYTGVLAIFASRLHNGQPPMIFEDGLQRRDFVHVEDVAEAVARIVAGAPGAGHPCYELGGPRVYSYAELLRVVADRTGARARLVPVPFALWEALAFLAGFAPGAPLTRGQVALMRRDNVASRGLPGLRELGIAPAALEDADRIAPETCRRYVEERFAPERMVHDYLRAYETMLAQ
jgi:nucleoside-diphosphate-sugar epimerase